MQGYESGIFIDANPVITNDNNPNYAIEQLNIYTNQALSNSSAPHDVWVWDKTNCSSGQNVYSATANITNGVTFSNSSITCISFN